MLPARWYGTTFNVLYSNEPSQKTPMKLHLVTSRDGFDLISLDWKASVQRFRTPDVDSVEAKGTTAVLTMNPNHKFTTVFLNTRPESCASIVEALTVQSPALSSSTDASPRALRVVIPSFNLPAGKIAQLQGFLVDETQQLLQAVECQTTVNSALVDAFTCVLRGRYSDDHVQNPDHAAKSAMLDLKSFLITTWCGGILKCIEGARSPPAAKWYAMIAEGCAQTVSKVGKGLSILCDDLMRALPSFPEGVAAAANRIRREANALSERGAAERPLHEPAALGVMCQLTVTLLAGIVVGMYRIDCDAMAAEVVQFTKTLGAHPNAVLQAQSRFIRAITCFMDGKRCHSAFHWVFCVWDFKDAVEAQ
jgi:hypothetical protein